MKKVLFFLVLTLFCNAQTNLWADYYGSGDYAKISFPSKNIGYISVINQQNHRLIKTVDAGNSYKEIAIFKNGIKDFFFVNDNVGYLITGYFVLYKTVDGGNTWFTLSNSGINYGTASKFYFNTENQGYIITDSNRIYKTNDGGLQWKLLEGVIGNEVTFINENIGWITNRVTGQIFKTTDQGNNWILQHQSNYQNIKNLRFSDAQHGWYLASSSPYYSAYETLFKTDDGGNTWVEINKPFLFEDIQFANNLEGIAVNSGAIYKTADGGNSWYKKMGFSTYDFYRSMISQNGNYYLVGSNSLIATSTDGNTWDTKKRLGMIPSFSLNNRKIVADSNYIYGLSRGFNNSTFKEEYFVTKIKHDGSAYESIPTNIPETNSDDVIYNLNSDFSNSSSDWYLSERPYKSENEGQTWIKLFDKQNPEKNYKFVSIKFFNKNNGVALNIEGKIYKSNNAGITWNLFNNIQQDSWERFLDFHFFNENIGIIISSKNQILKTNDGGATWSTKYSDSHNSDFQKLFFVNDLVGFAIRSSKVVKTTDGGETWSILDTDEIPTNMNIRDLYFLSANIGYLATSGGIFKTINGVNWVQQSNTVMDKIHMFNENSGFAMYDKLYYTYKPQVTPTYLVNPSNNENNVALDATLKWAAISGASAYYVSLGKSTFFETFNNTITSNTTFKPIANLDPNTKYYLRVVPYNSANESTGNIIFQFTTGNSLNTENIDLKKLSIYPNPVQGNILNISNADSNDYRIFDTSGKLIRSGALSGNTVNVKNLPTGVYIIQIGKTSTRFIKE